MNQYFTDYDIYDGNGVLVKWGNCFTQTDRDDILEIAESIKAEISGEVGISKDKIRFRQFNKIG